MSPLHTLCTWFSFKAVSSSPFLLALLQGRKVQDFGFPGGTRFLSTAKAHEHCRDNLAVSHHHPPLLMGVLLHRLQSAAGRVCLMSFCPQYLIPPAVLLPRKLLPVILVRSSSEPSLISVKAISSPLKCICKSKTEVLTHLCV